MVIFNWELARRADFGETLRSLRRRSIRSILVLANQPVRARGQLAATLGVDDVWHLPTLAAKIEQIRQLQQQGRIVCYVGNGQNDGPLMACADLSLSVAPLAAVASDAAQVLLLQDRLCALLCLFALGEQFAATGKQSVQWTFWPGVAGMAGALCGLGLVPSVLINDLGLLLGAGDLSALYAVAPQPERAAAARPGRTVGAEWLPTYAPTGPLAVATG
jgi:cation transport ATPase